MISLIIMLICATAIFIALKIGEEHEATAELLTVTASTILWFDLLYIFAYGFKL